MTDNVLRFDFLARDRASGVFESVGGKIGKLGKMAGVAVAGASAAVGGLAIAGISMGVKTAAALEQAQIGFATLLHSGQKAEVFLKDLQNFAASTPFELSGLIESSRTLIGVGLTTKQTKQALQDFGDAASAVGVGQENFKRIMLATSQAISAGKFGIEDLNQITENGIPIWKVLARATGEPVPKLRELATAGKLLSKDVLPLLEKQMHKDYGGAMAKQSMTLNGLWSTFTDTLSIGLAKGITPMIPALKVGLAGASEAAGKALAALPGILEKMTTAFKAVKGKVLPVMDGIADWATRTGIPRLKEFAGWMGAKGIPIIQSGFKTARANAEALWGKLNLSKVGDSIVEQAQTWGGLMLEGIQTGLTSGNWSELGKVFGDALTAAITAQSKGGAKIGEAIKDWFTSIDWLDIGKAVGMTAAPFALGFSLTLIDGLIDAFKKHPGEVLFAIATLIPIGKIFTVFKPLRGVLEALPFGKWIVWGLDHTAAPVFDAFWRFIKFAGRGIVKGFQEIFPASQGLLRRFITGIGDTLKLRAMYLAESAKRMIEGIFIGIGRMAGRLTVIAGRAIEWLTRPFRSAGGWLIRAGQNAVGGLIRGIGRTFGALGSAIGTAIRFVTSPFRAAGSWLYQSGRYLLTGLRNGIMSLGGAIGGWMANVGGRIVRAVKNFFGISSPSKVFTGIGRNLIRSLFGAMIDSNPKQTITRIFGGMPQALGALVDKGMLKISQLPGKALNALQGLGGKFADVLGFGGGGSVNLGAISAAERWIIMHESGGRTNADNPTSTAFGLGQLLLANRQHYGAILGVSAGTTDFGAQLSMFRMYVRDRYGTAENAQRFWQSHHWYGRGGIVSRPSLIGAGDGGPERVLSAVQTRDFSKLVRVLPALVNGGGGGLVVQIYATGSDIALENKLVQVITNARKHGRL